MGCSVFPHDAEDIKAHRWFRDIPWDRLHMIPPPFVPQIANLEDTRYFDEEEPVSDWSESQPESEIEMEDQGSGTIHDGMSANANSTLTSVPGMAGIATVAPPSLPGLTARLSTRKMAEMHATLAYYPKHLRTIMSQFVAAPYDSVRLKRIHREIEHMSPNQGEVEKFKDFIQHYGKKERKRPRDRLLRDHRTKRVVLEIRKQSAFLGYTWTRTKGRDFQLGILGAATLEAGDSEHLEYGDGEGSGSVAEAAYALWHGRRS